MNRVCFVVALAIVILPSVAAAQNVAIVQAGAEAAQAPIEGAAGPAADPSAAAMSADEAAIRASAARYAQAFNVRDAKMLAALWSPEAVYVDPDSGEEVSGRAAIEAYFAGVLKDEAVGVLEVEVTSVEMLSPSVAVEQGVARVIRPQEEPETTAYTAIDVKQGGVWVLDRVSESEAAAASASNYEHLKELEWMVGSWVDADDSASVQTDCEWTKNKNFMTRSFAIVTPGGVAMAGTQFVGWDPVAKQIRSWVFDSNGGFGEGRWVRKADRWVIDSTLTLADGGKSSAVNIIKQIDGDTFTWQSINRQVDGELLPNEPEVVVVRAVDAAAE